MTFHEFVDEVRKAAQRDDGTVSAVGIDPETYRFWKANAGNAKARRRWRRRNVPNAQRVSAQAHQECRLCAAFQTGQMGERRHCADHAAEAVRMYNALSSIRGAP